MRQRTPTERELFGMVVRDPFYEFNTDPVNYPDAPNRKALERQARELAGAGVRWIRMEFFADYDGTVPAGEINWSKYDWFIRELAPKYNLKVLALLNVGMVAHDGKTLRPIAFNDVPDRGGSDPNDGSNHFIRVFTARAQAIAARYGTAISAYEIINEPNISWDLWLDSTHGGAEIKPDRYAALIMSAYRAIKNVNNLAEVIVGGIMIGSPPEGQDHDQFDYLYQLYTSEWTDYYRGRGFTNRPGWNDVPWDGIALHPYFLEPSELFDLLNEFGRKMRDRGDHHSKLWITEIGAQARPPETPQQLPTQAERDQAHYLRAIYQGILQDPLLRSTVAHVFWFKYEDFVPGNYTHNYGIVRLLENERRDNYAPSGDVWVRKLAYKTYQEVAFGYAADDPVDEAEARRNNWIYFPETRQAIAPEFAAFWLEKGGLERFGYPVSRPVYVHGIWSQFFQRAVFEHHPEHEGTPNEVLLRRVGAEATRGRFFDTADPAALSIDRTYFPETGYSLGGAFKLFWEETGGLAVYGYPISEEIQEVSQTDGQTYTVQYFERNRFEHHPDAIGTPFEVQVGLLGAELFELDLWWR
ncbi:MAG TPA: hypothetical protein VFR15_08405 [Chloroflexia bacterium]|nr:hypothetical protein [Chloroflexia bacterium]